MGLGLGLLCWAGQSLRLHLHSPDAPAVEVKSLDLLAALPTPPHNQTEDVR